MQRSSVFLYPHSIQRFMPTQHGFLSFRVKSDLAASIEIAVGLASLYEVSSAVINGSSEIIPVENAGIK